MDIKNNVQSLITAF